MARGPIASHPVIAAEVYQGVIKDKPALKNTARATFYRALSTDPFFRNMRKRGDLRVEATAARGPGFPKAKWHFSEDGARRAASWLDKRLSTSSKNVAVKSEPVGKSESASVGTYLYRICHSFNIEPVFDGPTLNVEGTIERLAKAL
jgi:hypothetical protein